MAMDKLPMDPDLMADDVASRGRPKRPVRAEMAIVGGVGLGGVVGAVGRYGLSLAVPTVAGRFPWGTFLINVSGSAVLGVLLVAIMERFPRGRLARPVLGTGVIGAYTTFSTLTVEADLLVRDGHLMVAVLYVLASVAAGLVAVWLGMVGARFALRTEHPLVEEPS